MRWLKSDIAKFLIKALGIYLIWYLVYDCWLLPDGRLDLWMASNVASVCAGVLHSMGFDVYVAGRMFGIGEAPGIWLADGCTGISAMGLFVGFIIAYPGRWTARIAYIITGVGIIYFVNILRNTTLAVTQVYWPAFFEVTHDYSTTAIFYIVIFCMWIFWANYGDTPLFAKNENSSAGV